MPTPETFLTAPLTPSEAVLLNGAAFAPPAGLADQLPLLNGAVVAAGPLLRAVFAAAFLAAEQAGALRLEAGPRRTAFGLTKVLTVYVEPGELMAAWPAPSLEAALPVLAARLKLSGAHEAGAVVHAWLAAPSANPWLAAAEQIYQHLGERRRLTAEETVKFGFVKTRVWRLPAETAALAASAPAAVQPLLEACQRERPELWARLGEQIAGGLRQRLAAGAPAPARKADDDD